MLWLNHSNSPMRDAALLAGLGVPPPAEHDRPPDRPAKHAPQRGARRPPAAPKCDAGTTIQGEIPATSLQASEVRHEREAVARTRHFARRQRP
jgi:hypothetical protein